MIFVEVNATIIAQPWETIPSEDMCGYLHLQGLLSSHETKKYSTKCLRV